MSERKPEQTPAETGAPGNARSEGGRVFDGHIRASQGVEMSEVQIDTALYIQRMTADLAIMASRVELDLLAYLLDMARIEAFDRARHIKSGNP
ncbi:MAG: hypothetical protein H2045_03680 [Rhizobiales bacterium]|nr:hypothetical protein [Hyphomicrobiales bacterium]